MINATTSIFTWVWNRTKQDFILIKICCSLKILLLENIMILSRKIEMNIIFTFILQIWLSKISYLHSNFASWLSIMELPVRVCLTFFSYMNYVLARYMAKGLDAKYKIFPRSQLFMKILLFDSIESLPNFIFLRFSISYYDYQSCERCSHIG